MNPGEPLTGVGADDLFFGVVGDEGGSVKLALVITHGGRSLAAVFRNHASVQRFCEALMKAANACDWFPPEA